MTFKEKYKEEIIESCSELDTKKENELINEFDITKDIKDNNIMTIEEITQIENKLLRREDNLNFRDETLTQKEQQIDHKNNQLTKYSILDYLL